VFFVKLVSFLVAMLRKGWNCNGFNGKKKSEKLSLGEVCVKNHREGIAVFLSRKIQL